MELSLISLRSYPNSTGEAIVKLFYFTYLTSSFSMSPGTIYFWTN